MSDVRWEDQIALVTGASRGIGAAIALELARRGAKVVGTATSEPGAAAVSSALAGFAGCEGRVLNVTDNAALSDADKHAITEANARRLLRL